MTVEEIHAEGIRIINKEMTLAGIVDTAQRAYVLATAEWETNHTMYPVREAYWLSEAWRKRHLRYYPYYGRGYVQLTWEANYKKFGELLGIDLIDEPDLALAPQYAAKILVLGMRDGLFTGHKLDSYGSGDSFNFAEARHIINGNDKKDVIASIAMDYNSTGVHYA